MKRTIFRMRLLSVKFALDVVATEMFEKSASLKTDHLITNETKFFDFS